MDRNSIEHMIRDLGGAARVAAALQPYLPPGQTLSRSAVAQWRRVPLEYAVALETISFGKYNRRLIRPDCFWGETAGAARVARKKAA